MLAYFEKYGMIEDKSSTLQCENVTQEENIMAYEITGHTVLTGLLGSPVAHSISPMMHNEAFRQLELDYAYLAFDVGTDNLKTAVDGLKVMGVRGFNLTMPDKNLMCSLVDKISPASEIGGAVNTVVNDNGILTGYTTDGIGFMRAVSETGMDIIGKKMTLLGAGGAAAAILIITDDSVFRKDLFVFDVIYNPEETLFLKKAKAAGCQTLNGLNMLLYQGAASFELWTGKEMPVDIIKEKYFSR